MMRPHRLAAVCGVLLLTAAGPAAAAAATTLHIDLHEGGSGMLMTTATDHVKAGKVTFDVTNTSKGIEHEFLVAPWKGTPQTVPYDDSKGRVREADLPGLKELDNDLAPGKSGHMTLDLKPGQYLMFCNKPGHFKLGMYHMLTVTP